MSMARVFFLFLFILNYFLYADVVPTEGLLTSLDGEPSGIIDGHVNVISGGFIDQEVDLVIPGPEPLQITRTWLQKSTHSLRKEGLENTCYWVFGDDRYIEIKEANKNLYGSNSYFACYKNSFGQPLYFLFDRVDEKKRNYRDTWTDMLKLGVTNSSSGLIAAQTNVRNNSCNWKPKDKSFNMTTSNGTKIEFHSTNPRYYLIDRETKPNRMTISKTYENKNSQTILSNAEGVQLSSFTNLTDRKGHVLSINFSSNDGRYLRYKGIDVKLRNRDKSKEADTGSQLEIVNRPNAPQIRYEYIEGYVHENKKHPEKAVMQWPKISKKMLPENRTLEVNYFLKPEVDTDSSKFCKVKELKAPLGQGPELLVKYRFLYNAPDGGSHGGNTSVFDANGHLTEYVFNGHQRLKKVIKYDGNSAPYTEERLFWGARGEAQEIELQTRTFGPANQPYEIFCKRFHYDAAGNAVQEELWGNLTGKHGKYFSMPDGRNPVGGDCDVYVKKSTFTGAPYHLLAEKIEGRIRTNYGYLHNSNIPSVMYKSDEAGILERNFYFHDVNGLVICHIIDDGKALAVSDLTGVTERKIEHTSRSNSFPYGLPLIVGQYYLDLNDGQEKLIQEKRNTYDRIGRLVQQDTYDCNRELYATESWQYDDHGNCLLHTDPLGQQVISTYDANDNKITEQGPNLALTKKYSYDYMNRPILIEELHPDGILTKGFRYDLCSNQIASIDALGNETTTEYDAFNRPVRVTTPLVLTEKGEWKRLITQYSFDEMGNIASVTDPDGNTTQFEYTLHKKPYRIQYPDGSLELFEYDLEGRLVKEVAKNGTTTLYTLDSQGRTLEKKIFSASGELLAQTSAVYNTYRLLSETDAEGNVTTYSYDFAGRKTSSQKDEQITYYKYDQLGRLVQTVVNETANCVKYDPLNRVIEESLELIDGTILKCTQYTYDADNHRIITSIQTPDGPSLVQTHYDTHEIPLRQIDPLGFQTTTIQCFDYVNEAGQKTLCIESIDPQGIKSVTIQDAIGRLVKEQKFDPFGTLLQESIHTYNGSDKILKTVRNVMAGGRLIREVVTLFEYDSLGRLVTLINAAETPDEKRHTTHYNAYGEKDVYTKPDGVSLRYTYDALGRLVDFTASDSSFHYQYTYDAMSRPIVVKDLVLNRSSVRLYDRFGNTTQETLANDLIVKMDYTLEGQIKTIALPDNSSIRYNYEGPRIKTVQRANQEGDLLYQHEYASYDCAGRLVKSDLLFNAGSITTEYSLNNSVLKIKTPHYEQSNQYDSVGNLIAMNTSEGMNSFAYDSLYQLSKEEGIFNNSYSHDSLYNRTSKNDSPYTLNALNQVLSDGVSSYTYDLSGNLLATSHAKFTYDALDRLTYLISEEQSLTFTYDENNRCMTISDGLHTERLLYIGQNDIGTYSQENQCKNLRLLGAGLAAEIGAAVAVEIDGTPYIPIHDHNGNVVQLLNSNGTPYESYRYTVFGEESTPPSTLNPWRFSSKRTLAGYVFFGRRLYDPQLGRWLSPDPAGYDAGPNLYAYVSNNPLTHFDAYGLFELDTSFNWSDRFLDDAPGIEDLGDSWIPQFGGLMQSVFWHASFTDLRNIGMSAGYFLEHKTLEGYKPTWDYDGCKYEKMEDKPLFRGNTIIVYINGMNCSLAEAQIQQGKISEAFGGVRVDLIYNAERGTGQSGYETICSKYNINTEASKLSIKHIKELVDEAKNLPNGQGQVVGIGFSQGGEYLLRGTAALSLEDRSYMSTYTLGSATFIGDIGQRGYHNYVSNWDPIPLIANFSYLSARFGFVDGVTFLPNTSKKWIDHAMSSSTYESAIEYIAEGLQKKEK